jgi:hypothetical protein
MSRGPRDLQYESDKHVYKLITPSFTKRLGDMTEVQTSTFCRYQISVLVDWLRHAYSPCRCPRPQNPEDRSRCLACSASPLGLTWPSGSDHMKMIHLNVRSLAKVATVRHFEGIPCKMRKMDGA